MIMIEYEPRREKICPRVTKHLYYLCSDDKGADQLRSHRATSFSYLYHQKVGFLMTRLIYMSDFPSSLKGLVVMVLVFPAVQIKHRRGSILSLIKVGE